jgi:hypothetical protein
MRHVAVHHAEAQAAALADLLGGEERVERARDHLGRHPAAGVVDGKHHILAELELRIDFGEPGFQHEIIRLDGDPAASRHGVAGVDAQVEHRILELRLIDPHRPQLVRHDDVDADLLAERGAQQRKHLFDRNRQIEGAKLQRLDARKRQQPLHQIGTAQRRLQCIVENGFEFRAVAGLVDRKLEIADHAGQQIVEIVGDAAGQLADRFHLLGLHELACHRTPLARHLQQQRNQHDARGDQPVDPACIKAEIIPRRPDDRRKGDVHEPGAHDDHQPKVEDRGLPSPQGNEHQQRDHPIRRTDALGDADRVVPVADELRQQRLAGGRHDGEHAYERDDAEDGGSNHPSESSLGGADRRLPAQDHIGEHEQREAAVPELIEPRGRLRTGTQEPGRCEDTRKGQNVRDDHQGVEQVPGRERQHGARANLDEMIEKQHRGNQIADEQRRLVGRDEGRHRGERYSHIRNRGKERDEQERQEQDGKQPFSTLRRRGGYESTLTG